VPKPGKLSPEELRAKRVAGMNKARAAKIAKRTQADAQPAA
jgi:hypothetical protein